MPTVTTIYHHDEDGRITHTEAVSEPEWLEEDVAWHKAFLRWRAELCPGCSMSLVETTEMRDGEPVHSYHVPDPRRCQGCDARIKAQDEHAKKGTVRPDSLIWSVEREDSPYSKPAHSSTASGSASMHA